jgi:hypothetical protein
MTRMGMPDCVSTALIILVSFTTVASSLQPGVHGLLVGGDPLDGGLLLLAVALLLDQQFQAA